MLIYYVNARFNLHVYARRSVTSRNIACGIAAHLLHTPVRSLDGDVELSAQSILHVFALHCVIYPEQQRATLCNILRAYCVLYCVT